MRSTAATVSGPSVEALHQGVERSQPRCPDFLLLRALTKRQYDSRSGPPRCPDFLLNEQKKLAEMAIEQLGTINYTGAARTPRPYDFPDTITEPIDEVELISMYMS
jgi:hypothetical protein